MQNCKMFFCLLELSVQFSCSVISYSLWPHRLQHTRLPYPSPPPRACSNSCLLSHWCHPTISSSVSTSPPAFILSQHQYLFQRVSSLHQFSSVQSLSRVRLFVTWWIEACQASLSITNSRSSLKLMSIKSVMPCSHLIICHPFLLLPPIPPSIRVFSNESILRMRWPKYWSFSFSIIPSKEIPGLISFRMDWLEFLAVQGTLKSLLQHHSSKASILLCWAFFTVQLSHPYMTTGKTIALTRRTFVGKVMSLLLNMLSRFIITFIPKSKRLLISWLQSPSAVISEPRKIKSATVSIVSHLFAMKWWDRMPWS